jgi:hypothetical protein
MFSDILIRLRALFRRDAVEGELDDELRFHFEQQVAKYVRDCRARKRGGARGWNSAERSRSKKNAATLAA